MMCSEGWALHHAQISAAFDDFVGRAPRPAADPLVGLLKRTKSRTRGSGADGASAPHSVAAVLLCGAGGAGAAYAAKPYR